MGDGLYALLLRPVLSSALSRFCIVLLSTLVLYHEITAMACVRWGQNPPSIPNHLQWLPYEYRLGKPIPTTSHTINININI